jgi:hypothetical protein
MEEELVYYDQEHDDWYYQDVYEKEDREEYDGS